MADSGEGNVLGKGLGVLINPTGESSRGQFALVALPHMAIWITLAALAQVSDALALAAILYWLPGVYIAFVAVVRRFHDMGKSGWWFLLMLVPLVNFGTIIALLVIPGEKEIAPSQHCSECHLIEPDHLDTCSRS